VQQSKDANMLSQAHKTIVAATVPALEGHGEAITKVFYRNLLDAHPELFDFFNPANQRDGGQASSLATAVLRYAKNIADPSRLGTMVERIANKHVGLQVRAEHYPVVGRYLLGAIGEVLGDDATPEIVSAWQAAYDQLAAIMIGRETSLAQEVAGSPAGWSRFQHLRVSRKTAESATMTSFVLERPDGGSLPNFVPGQYLTIKVRASGFDHQQIRQYSLCCAPNGRHFEIAVQRESSHGAPNGLVSHHLHDHVTEGDLLEVHAPLGDFQLVEGVEPVTLLAGGSGITAMLGMLEYLAGEHGGDRNVTLLHAVRDRAHHAFGPRIRALARKRPDIRVGVIYSQVSPGDERGVHYDHVGRLTAELLATNPSLESTVYWCGPPGFMAAVDRILDTLAVPSERRFSEAFAPDRIFGS
jgi:nitric oxide dioxygenase